MKVCGAALSDLLEARRLMAATMRKHLEVPYRRQSAEFSCGPACVLMALRHFIPSTPATKSKEFEIWRDTNMIGIGGADPFGLSVPLLKAGLQVTVITQRVETFPFERFKRLRGEGEARLARFAIRDSYRRATELGLQVAFRRPTREDVQEALREDRLPIALVGMNVVHGFDIPHWVVVTGMEDGAVWVNDPYPPKGRKGLRLEWEELETMMEDIPGKVGGSRSLVIVGKPRWERVVLPRSGIEYARETRYTYTMYLHLDLESPPVTFDVRVREFAEGGDKRYEATASLPKGAEVSFPPPGPVTGRGDTENDAIQGCLASLYMEMARVRSALREAKGIRGRQHGGSPIR